MAFIGGVYSSNDFLSSRISSLSTDDVVHLLSFVGDGITTYQVGVSVLEVQVDMMRSFVRGSRGCSVVAAAKVVDDVEETRYMSRCSDGRSWNQSEVFRPGSLDSRGDAEHRLYADHLSQVKNAPPLAESLSIIGPEAPHSEP